MSDVASHDCLANAKPLVDSFQANRDGPDIPLLSAVIGDGGVTAYFECTECGQELEVEYEYSDHQDYPN